MTSDINFSYKLNFENKEIIAFKSLLRIVPLIVVAGKNKISTGEIIINESLLSILGLSETDINSNLDKIIMFNVSANGKNFVKEYKIKGITQKMQKEVYVANYDFQEVLNSLDFPSKKLKYTYSFSTKDKNQVMNLIKAIEKNGLYGVNFKMDELNWLTRIFENERNGFLLYLLLSLTFAFIIIYYFTNVIIKNNLKNIGILFCLGYSWSKILTLFVFENVKVLLCSFLLSLGCWITAINFINQHYKDIMISSINLFYSDILYVPISILIIIFILIISLVLPFIKLKKRSPVEIIQKSFH